MIENEQKSYAKISVFKAPLFFSSLLKQHLKHWSKLMKYSYIMTELWLLFLQNQWARFKSQPAVYGPRPLVCPPPTLVFPRCRCYTSSGPLPHLCRKLNSNNYIWGSAEMAAHTGSTPTERARGPWGFCQYNSLLNTATLLCCCCQIC